jgi:phosphatidylethanolamine/phosphatidyl-N-methylethanolamine N-methyltransferase
MGAKSKSIKKQILDEYYNKIYKNYLFGNNLQSLGISSFEKDLESYWINRKPMNTLEIGSGSGEHFRFVRDIPSKSYVAVDLYPFRVENFSLDISDDLNKILWNIAGDAEDLPFGDNSFCRTSATCIFHHLEDPLSALLEVRRVTRIGGEISIVLPTDPGLLNQLVKKLYSYRRLRDKISFKPELIYALEHPNHIPALLELIRFVFSNDDLRFRFKPFHLKSWNLNLWVHVHILKKTL